MSEPQKAIFNALFAVLATLECAALLRIIWWLTFGD